MPRYKAPVRDMQFILHDLLAIESYTDLPGFSEISTELVDQVLESGARFSEEVLFPINFSGDKEGCTRNPDASVTTPKGFKEAYQQYIEGGWQGLSHPIEYGGQGMPMSLGIIKSEMIGTANWAWSMYPGLSLGAMNTLMLHGTEKQKEIYLT